MFEPYLTFPSVNLISKQKKGHSFLRKTETLMAEKMSCLWKLKQHIMLYFEAYLLFCTRTISDLQIIHLGVRKWEMMHSRKGSCDGESGSLISFTTPDSHSQKPIRLLQSREEGSKGFSDASRFSWRLLLCTQRRDHNLVQRREI